MQDYWGHNKASKPMLPMIGIPTTAGTGSEAQSYALISDPATHVKMACGDDKAAFRIAILDPCLIVSEPAGVRGASGYDAISHAVESYVTTARNGVSQMCALEAWLLLNANFERAMTQPGDLEALGGMLLGAHLAGIAIENSMLGATHACANPLTAHYGTTHGVAIAALLPHVVRWNSPVVGERYAVLSAELPALLADLAQAGGLPCSLRDACIPGDQFETLAAEAAQQWTGRHNPRPFDAAGALEIYQCAY
ncbi:MAG: iron-containing alcohol dehydrogenase, partial [Bryobacteraceae bacterium]